jgi:DNA replication and repair protein RecF
LDIAFLQTEAFRNLSDARLEFHPQLNLVVGDNGQGKTNLLEALAIVTGRPSFRTVDLADVRQHGTARTVLTARRRGDGATLGVVLADGAREHYRDGERVSRLAAAREAPFVFLTARDLTRLTGSPAERRRALDRAALARDPDFGRTLSAYEKARASKARLLALRHRFDADELAVYETTMADAGAAIAVARRRAAAALVPEIAANAARLKSSFRDLALELVSDVPAEGTEETFAAALRSAMRARSAEERRAGRCLVGPHRDDAVLRAAGVPLATRASSGENRTIVLAWTLAELALLAVAAGTGPALAFDDFDSEWDPAVLAAFARALPEGGQVFLTSARPEAVRGLPLPAGFLFRMSAGRLAREGILGAGRGEGANGRRVRAGER